MAKSTRERPEHAVRPELDLANAAWQPGSRGIGDVQIAFVEGFIAMRRGRAPGGPAVVFTPMEWRAFVRSARIGRFDHPRPRPFP
ncbi:DUF397 domain-containing protein [Streptomyces sp. NPDC002537]